MSMPRLVRAVARMPSTFATSTPRGATNSPEAFGVRERSSSVANSSRDDANRPASFVARPRMAMSPAGMRRMIAPRSAMRIAELATSCSRSVCRNTTSTNFSRSTLRSRHASPATEPPGGSVTTSIPSRANDCSAAVSAQQATVTGSPRAASPRAAAAKARAEPDHPCAV